MFTKSKQQPNFTSLVTHNVPKGVGNKPGKPKRKGPSNSKRPDIVSYADPFSVLVESEQPQVHMENGLARIENGPIRVESGPIRVGKVRVERGPVCVESGSVHMERGPVRVKSGPV